MLSTQTSPGHTGDSAAFTGYAFVLQFNQGCHVGYFGITGATSHDWPLVIWPFIAMLRGKSLERLSNVYLSFSSHLNWFPPPSTKSLIIARNKPHTGQGGGWRFPPQSRQWPATAPLDTPPLWTAPNVVCRLASLMANLADWIERSSQSCIMRMKHKTFSTFS